MTESTVAGLLDTPQRQLPIAIVAEFFGGAALRQFGETLLPVVLVSIATRGQLTLVLLPVAALVVLVLVVVRWWRTTFWVEHGELILERGILNRTRLQLPLDRIQQISTEQGVIQQLFDVRKVSVDTAGSVGVEFSLTAVSNDVVAELRQLIVGADRLEPLPPMARDLVAGMEPPPIGPPAKELQDRASVARAGFATSARGQADAVLRMRFVDLVQVGLVRPGGQVLSAVTALLGLGVGRAVDSFVESRLTSAAAAGLFIAGGVVFAAVALVGGAVLRDFELTVWRSQQGLRLTAGLLTKREQFARIERAQLVRRRANPLERMLDRTTVMVLQATSVPAASSSSTPSTQNFTVPSVPNDTVDRLTSLFLHPGSTDLSGTISPRARWRWSLYGAAWPALALVAGATILAGAGGPTGVAATLVIVAVVVFVGGAALASAQQRRWRWQFDGEALRTRHGVLVDQRVDVEVRKIQSVRLQQGWWQRRHGLATINCSTAGGSLTIPHLDLATAASLRDAVLGVVEQSEGPWM